MAVEDTGEIYLSDADAVNDRKRKKAPGAFQAPGARFRSSMNAGDYLISAPVMGSMAVSFS